MRLAKVPLVIVAAMMIAAACSVGQQSPETVAVVTTAAVGPDSPDALDDLADARVRWHAAERPWYRYVFRALCDCDALARRPHEVLVRGNEVVDVTYRGSAPAERPAAHSVVEAFTVEELHAMIETSIEGGRQTQVTYRDDGAPGRMQLGLGSDNEFAIAVTELNDPLEDLEQLAEARAQWTAAGITDYTFHYSSGSLAHFEYTVTVRGNETVVDGDHELGPRSIEEAFEAVELAILVAPVAFSATYDPATGVPSGWDVDYEESAVDDEESPRISRFEVLAEE